MRRTTAGMQTRELTNRVPMRQKKCWVVYRSTVHHKLRY